MGGAASQAESLPHKQRISGTARESPSQAETDRRKQRISSASRDGTTQAENFRHNQRISVASRDGPPQAENLQHKQRRDDTSREFPVQPENLRRKQRRTAASREFPAQAETGRRKQRISGAAREFRCRLGGPAQTDGRPGRVGDRSIVRAPMDTSVTLPALAGPVQEGGVWFWRASAPGVEVRFAGRGGDSGGSRDAVLAAVAPDAPPVAWTRQIHSATVLAARRGACGEGDALVTEHARLALSIATADCVPVLLAGAQGLAAVHAGWRGLVGGVIAAALERLGGRGWTAWVGPAIGPCCYEVGDDVAAEVARASTTEAVVATGREKPHLDLYVAAVHQLRVGGVEHVEVARGCTRCDAERLHSYRREGRAAGRNLAFIWRA